MKSYLSALHLRFLRWSVKNPYLSYNIHRVILASGAFAAGFIVAILIAYGLPVEVNGLWMMAGAGIGVVMGPIMWLQIAVLIHEVEVERQKMADEWAKQSLDQIAQMEADYDRLNKKERQALLRKWTVAEQEGD